VPQSPAEVCDIVMGVDLPVESEHVARELVLGCGNGRVDGVMTVHLDQRVDVVGVIGPGLGDSSRRVAESVSFQQAR
jgi:hypothetical protein